MVPGIWITLGQLLKYGITMVWLSLTWEFDHGIIDFCYLWLVKVWSLLFLCFRPPIVQTMDENHTPKAWWSSHERWVVMSHASFPKAPILTGTLRENQALVVGMLQRIFQLLQATSGKSDRLTWWRINLFPLERQKPTVFYSWLPVCKSAELMSLRIVSSNLSPGKSWTDSHNLQESMVSSRPFNVWEMCWQRLFKGHSKSPTFSESAVALWLPTFSFSSPTGLREPGHCCRRPWQSDLASSQKLPTSSPVAGVTWRVQAIGMLDETEESECSHFTVHQKLQELPWVHGLSFYIKFI